MGGSNLDWMVEQIVKFLLLSLLTIGVLVVLAVAVVEVLS